ncbi:MAG: phenylalanine--tRNA ligase subunit beta [Deltaproteobacteria bacterium]|nr:phenylalanine--tRNA ligase subunit beta [Deltaproteobacteria bacterium]
MAIQVPLSWIRDFVSIKITPDQLADRLTTAGLEVESIENIGDSWGEYCVVGELREIRKHPNADNLNLVDVEFGADKPITIVTGAPNISQMEGNLPSPVPKVALALSGAMLFDAHNDGHPLKKLKSAKIRGIESEGMLCSELELGLSENHEGILILPEDAPMGTLLKDYLGDVVLHFDIKGGFSHLLSILGIGREIAAMTEENLNQSFMPDLSKLKVFEQPPFVDLEINASDICSRYSALLIRNVEISPSPFWMQQRLLRLGMRPINNIVDITNYVMMELGQPLHAFDYDKLINRTNGDKPKITIRRAREGESMITLDNVERKLDSEMLMITDEVGHLGIAGVMGGQNSEVTDKTTNILLEAANFEFLNNRRTSQILKLRTEASERFGKQVDPEGTLRAALRAAELIVEYGSGTLEEIAGDLYPSPKEEVTLEINPKYVERLLGINITVEQIKKILNALEFKVSGKKILKIIVPSHRMDIRIPADLVEEIVRVYGFENLTPTLIKDELPPQRGNQNLEGIERLRDILVSSGMDEIITYSIMDPTEEADLQLEKHADLDAFVPIKNPLSQERSHLRRSLLPGALITARTNLRFLDRVNTFEVGSVFHPQKGNILPNEPQRLSLLMSGVRYTNSWLNQDKGNYDFFDLKGVLEHFFKSLHLDDVDWEKSRELPCHPGRCANILVNGSVLGFAGELHPKIRGTFNLPEQPVCIAELDLDLIIKFGIENYQMKSISNYTPIFEDLAIVVDAGMPLEKITPVILKTGNPLLKKATLFDIYEGEQVDKGKKSLAYSLTFQAPDRTLTDDEVGKIREKIVRRLANEFQATLRN